MQYSLLWRTFIREVKLLSVFWDGIFREEFLDSTSLELSSRMLAVAFYNLFWNPFPGQNGLQNDIADGQPQILICKNPVGTRGWSWKQNQDTHLCHSRWFVKVVFMSTHSLKSTSVVEQQLQWHEGSERTCHGHFRNLWRLLWAWFAVGVFSSTCALWKPVAMSHSRYPQGRIRKLQCNCRYRDCNQGAASLETLAGRCQTSPSDLNYFCSLRKQAHIEYKMYRKIFKRLDKLNFVTDYL